MKIGFIGLGTMGASMALNLRKAGYALAVNDVRRDAAAAHLEAGCVWADSARDVGRASDVVFTSLPGPKEIEAVALSEEGLLAGMRRGATWFDLSTNSPTLIRSLHERFAQHGIAVLDAPKKPSPFVVDDLFCSAPLAVYRNELYAGSQRDGALYQLGPPESRTSYTLGSIGLAGASNSR